MRLNSSLLLIVLLGCTFFCANGQTIITPYFMYFSTNYTNNGGVDNSTCDLSIDGAYASGLSGDNYAAFFITQTEPALMFYDNYQQDGDQGIGCFVNYVSNATSITCSSFTVVDGSAADGLSEVKKLTVKNVYGDDSFFSVSVELSLGMFPRIYNKSMENWPWMLYAHNAPSTSTAIDFTTLNTYAGNYDGVLTYISAPSCGQGYYNSLQSDAFSLSSMMSLIAFTVF